MGEKLSISLRCRARRVTGCCQERDDSQLGARRWAMGMGAGGTPNLLQPCPAGASCATRHVPTCHVLLLSSAQRERWSAPGGACVGRTPKHCCSNGESGRDGERAQSWNNFWMHLPCQPLFSEKWPISSTSETVSVHHEGSRLLLYQFTLMRLEKLTRKRYRSLTNDSSLFRLPRVM